MKTPSIIRLGLSTSFFDVTPCITALPKNYRLLCTLRFMGELNGGFYGPEIAFEAPLSQGLSFNLNGTAGFGKSGRLLFAQSGLRYYFGKVANQGFFVGAGGKIFFFSEEGDQSLYADDLYAVYISLGFKSRLADNLFLLVHSSMHKTLGGINEADVAGIGIGVGVSYRF